MHKTLKEFRDSPNSLDSIRLVCAVMVIFSHGFPLTDNPEPLSVLTGSSLGHLGVCVFFVVSGYLIPQSFDKGSLKRFISNRAVRILPGLAVAVAFCVFVIGPLYTTLPVGAYFADRATWAFLGQAFFLPTGTVLPGVFADNPGHSVNGSLWTLRFEAACYAFVAIVGILARHRTAVVVLALAFSFPLARMVDPDAGGLQYYIGNGAVLYRYFGMGTLLYIFADRIPVARTAMYACYAIVAVSAFTPFFTEACAIFGSYAVLATAYLVTGHFASFTGKGDISYGIYIYAYPIQQVLVPVSIGALGAKLAPYVNALLTLPFVAALAILSWMYVEKPSLRRKREPRLASSPG